MDCRVQVSFPISTCHKCIINVMKRPKMGRALRTHHIRKGSTIWVVFRYRCGLPHMDLFFAWKPLSIVLKTSPRVKGGSPKKNRSTNHPERENITENPMKFPKCSTRISPKKCLQLTSRGSFQRKTGKFHKKTAL